MKRAVRKIAILSLTSFMVYKAHAAILQSADRTETEATFIIQPIFKDIASSNWDEEIFEKHTSPALKKWFKANGSDVISSYKGLGGLVKFKDIKNIENSGTVHKSTSLVQFENGLVSIRLSLSKHEKKWLIDNIFIESASL